MSNYYINSNGEVSSTGSVVVVETVDANSNKIKYYIYEMHIDFFSGI